MLTENMLDKLMYTGDSAKSAAHTAPQDLRSKKRGRCALAVALMLIVVFGALAFLYVRSMTVVMRNEAAMALSESAQHMSVIVRAAIDGRINSMQTFARSLAAAPLSTSQIRERLAGEMSAQGYSSLAVVDESGVWLDGSGEAYRVNQEDAFERVVSTNAPCISTLMLFNGQDSLILMSPLNVTTREGKRFMALAAVYTIYDIENLLLLNAYDDMAYPFVIDSSGNMVIPSRHSSAHGLTYNYFEYLQQSARLSGDSTVQALNEQWTRDHNVHLAYNDLRLGMNNALTLAALTQIGIEDWILVTPVPASVLTTQADRFIMLTIAISAALCLIFGSGCAYIIITRQRSQARLEHIAYTDELTGGYNCEFFRLRARELLDSTADSGYALIYSNIVNFKLYNDWYGFEKGDDAIRRMHTCISNELDMRREVLGRASTDHFCMLMRYESPPNTADRLGRIVHNFAESSLFWEFGVYVVEDRKMSIQMLEDRATLALKNDNKYRDRTTSIAFYDAHLHRQMQLERELEDIMYDALRDNQFEVYIQPKYDLQQRRICGGEALIRWNHPTRGYLSPDEFVPLFERNGFIVQIDQFVFRKVCELQTQWLAQGVTCVPISVNLSRVHFGSTLFLDAFRNILRENKTDGKLLALELTETIIYENMNRIQDIVDEIHSLGMQCDMDDFGSGYSSLNMLKSVSVDCLKLDRAFFLPTNSLEMKQKQSCIIESVVRMTSQLGMLAVAEGVETVEQVDFLSRIGCNCIQGYVFYRPMPTNEFKDLLLKAGTP